MPNKKGNSKPKGEGKVTAMDQQNMKQRLAQERSKVPSNSKKGNLSMPKDQKQQQIEDMKKLNAAKTYLAKHITLLFQDDLEAKLGEFIQSNYSQQNISETEAIDLLEKYLHEKTSGSEAQLEREAVTLALRDDSDSIYLSKVNELSDNFKETLIRISTKQQPQPINSLKESVSTLVTQDEEEYDGPDDGFEEEDEYEDDFEEDDSLEDGEAEEVEEEQELIDALERIEQEQAEIDANVTEQLRNKVSKAQNGIVEKKVKKQTRASERKILTAEELKSEVNDLILKIQEGDFSKESEKILGRINRTTNLGMMLNDLTHVAELKEKANEIYENMNRDNKKNRSPGYRELLNNINQAIQSKINKPDEAQNHSQEKPAVEKGTTVSKRTINTGKGDTNTRQIAEREAIEELQLQLLDIENVNFNELGEQLSAQESVEQSTENLAKNARTFKLKLYPNQDDTTLRNHKNKPNERVNSLKNLLKYIEDFYQEIENDLNIIYEMNEEERISNLGAMIQTLEEISEGIWLINRANLSGTNITLQDKVQRINEEHEAYEQIKLKIHLKILGAENLSEYSSKYKELSRKLHPDKIKDRMKAEIKGKPESKSKTDAEINAEVEEKYEAKNEEATQIFAIIGESKEFLKQLNDKYNDKVKIITKLSIEKLKDFRQKNEAILGVKFTNTTGSESKEDTLDNVIKEKAIELAQEEIKKNLSKLSHGERELIVSNGKGKQINDEGIKTKLLSREVLELAQEKIKQNIGKLSPEQRDKLISNQDWNINDKEIRQVLLGKELVSLLDGVDVDLRENNYYKEVIQKQLEHIKTEVTKRPPECIKIFDEAIYTVSWFNPNASAWSSESDNLKKIHNYIQTFKKLNTEQFNTFSGNAKNKISKEKIQEQATKVFAKMDSSQAIKVEDILTSKGAHKDKLDAIKSAVFPEDKQWLFEHIIDDDKEDLFNELKDRFEASPEKRVNQVLQATNVQDFSPIQLELLATRKKLTLAEFKVYYL